MIPSLFLTLGWLPVLSGTGQLQSDLTSDLPATAQAASEVQVELAESWADTIENADRVSRRSLCREAHQGTRDAVLHASELARLQGVCPAEFPVVAPPDFCLTGRCATR